ncbi:YihY/virulence factor BrkB family protein [Streptacidiphilus sp. PB12-B1b]|uniref:YihY/virulence factor BrkB family protein n=1 Tax=Streptacidiphilus sp. PB12-B1b TaxID=2705012 RepID=UPI001CDD8BE1|nr:YhjD/YihY/BrkB family envelope integrity protein [Streptacidiphilus sp. PB12-B1b]QMU79235.1 YihY/virulence factor BrkB family protein [Streptacidiphilus sp. PB12-B1b]
MDWLTRLPMIGPVAAWVLKSRPYRVFEHFNDVGSNQLAGAVTFFGFLALFPLLTVAMAVAVSALSGSQVRHFQDRIEDQLPGLANALDLDALVRNAGTVGVVGGALLLVSGLGWVNTTRVSIRTVWRLPAEPGNPVLRRVLDVGVLLGLGPVAAVSLGASALTSALTGQLAHWLGIQHSSVGRFLLSAAAVLIAIGSDMLLFAYVLVGLPRIGDQRRTVVAQGALMGAVGFELLKQLLSAYLSDVARKSVYGAFGTPVALLLWINFIFRWLFYCTAWTATADPDAARRRALDRAQEAWQSATEATPTPAPAPSPSPAPPSPSPSPCRTRPLPPPRPAALLAALATAFATGAATTHLAHRRRHPTRPRG